MRVDVNGTRLWFDVDGSGLVPDGDARATDRSVVTRWARRLRPLVLQARLRTADAPGAGRLPRPAKPWPSARHDFADWSFEVCADDVRAFCDVLGIAKPIVYGHSMGGFVAMLYGARHPGHAAALVLQSTNARFDLARLVEGFRRCGGDDVAELAQRDYSGDPMNDEEWARIFAAFGPRVPISSSWAAGSGTPRLGRMAWSCFASSTSSASWRTSPARPWRAWANSTPSPRLTPHARSSARCPGALVGWR